MQRLPAPFAKFLHFVHQINLDTMARLILTIIGQPIPLITLFLTVIIIFLHGMTADEQYQIASDSYPVPHQGM